MRSLSAGTQPRYGLARLDSLARVGDDAHELAGEGAADLGARDQAEEVPDLDRRPGGAGRTGGQSKMPAQGLMISRSETYRRSPWWPSAAPSERRLARQRRHQGVEVVGYGDGHGHRFGHGGPDHGRQGPPGPSSHSRLSPSHSPVRIMAARDRTLWRQRTGLRSWADNSAGHSSPAS